MALLPLCTFARCDMGFRCKTISRNTLANANATRPWQIYADLAQHLIAMARPLYAKEPLGVPVPADHEGRHRFAAVDWLPDADALDGSARAMKELVGRWVGR